MRKIRDHVSHIRMLYDWPGQLYHDHNAGPGHKFNRWFMHNPTMLMAVHHRGPLIRLATRVFGTEVKPSYCFVAMYGPDGVCPRHKDRDVCYGTIDLMVDTDATEKPWPLVIEGPDGEDVAITLQPGQAVVYAGHTQPHQREPMDKASDSTYANLVFFHFVPVAYKGPLD